MHPIDNVLKW